MHKREEDKLAKSFKWILNNAPNEVCEDVKKMFSSNVNLANMCSAVSEMNIKIYNIAKYAVYGIAKVDAKNLDIKDLMLSLEEMFSELSSYSTDKASQLDIDQILIDAAMSLNNKDNPPDTKGSSD